MTPPPVVRRAARAKLNLYLHVIGRRADGYHLLDSLVAFAAVGDEVSAAPGDGLSLAVEGPFAAALSGEADNLVLRAARALASAASVPANASLVLTKRLPVASGIGGGSADAAAALLALRDLWRLDLDDAALARIGLGLGADVPVCLAGRAAHMGGIGERLDPAPPLPSAPLVLVNPGIPLATPPVFRARTGPFSAPAPLTQAPRDVRALAAALGARRNDLTAAATGIVPEIDAVITGLAESEDCLLTRMSGSGATCFGLFANRAKAEAAAAALAERHPEWWVAATVLADS